MQFEDAVDVFGHGIAACKSLFGPYVYEKTEGFGVLRDGPERKGPGRLVEVIACGQPVDRVMDFYHSLPMSRKFLCVFVRDGIDHLGEVAAYRARGMRLMVREPLFVMKPERAHSVATEAVRRVDNWEDALLVNRAAGSRQVLASQLEEGSPNRLYAAWEGGTPVGWVRSVSATRFGNWVSNLYVLPEHRRKGLGSQLMGAMLAEDLRLGVSHSVLLSSHVGALLYPTLGYEYWGKLVLFRPKRGPGATGTLRT
ncbi:MAG: GNAT family N-acetyltransferase [Armatimonadetes bacterium]|nr:GNAT family N-acetyltransferase [Armatimonadota bacterium]